MCAYVVCSWGHMHTHVCPYGLYTVRSVHTPVHSLVSPAWAHMHAHDCSAHTHVHTQLSYTHVPKHSHMCNCFDCMDRCLILLPMYTDVQSPPVLPTCIHTPMHAQYTYPHKIILLAPIHTRASVTCLHVCVHTHTHTHNLYTLCFPHMHLSCWEVVNPCMCLCVPLGTTNPPNVAPSTPRDTCPVLEQDGAPLLLGPPWNQRPGNTEGF